MDYWAGRDSSGQDRGQMGRRGRYNKHQSPSGQGAGYNSRTHNGPHYSAGRDGHHSSVDNLQVHNQPRSQNLRYDHPPHNYHPQANNDRRGRGGHSQNRPNGGKEYHGHNHPQSHNNYRKKVTATFDPYNTRDTTTQGSVSENGNFNNINYFQGGNHNTHHRQDSVPGAGGFHRQRSTRGQGSSTRGYRGSGGGYNHTYIPYPCPPSSSETVVDYDIYDADASSSVSEDAPNESDFLGRWVANPLTEVASELDSTLLNLLRNSPQLNTTLCHFMHDYSGPDDMEFWMNTVGAENMRWEVLHEIESSSLQMPPGWNCAMKGLEERQLNLNPNNAHKPARPHTGLRQ